MKILTSTELSLHLASPWSDTALARSEVVFNGKKTGRVITGEVLEAAVEWQSYRILFVTDNILSEDYLRIYLLDAQWQVVDSATLGAMYATGAFSGLELRPPNSVRFNFIGDVSWTIELLDTPSLSLPFSAPKGVSRPLSLLRHFNIKGRPRPESARSDAIER